MKILHVTMGIDPKSGGTTRSVKGLCRALDRAGIDVTLLVLHGHDEFEDSGGVCLFYGKEMDVLDFDIIHLHGLWNWGLHKIALACRRQGKPYIYSPRGMLDPWALSVKKWKKRLAMALYQRSDLKRATAFHATADAEASHIRNQVFAQKMVIAPNGVEVPASLPTGRKYTKDGVKTALFLSRLHPGKGLVSLARAWADVKPAGWRMLVVGPDDYGHKREVISALDRLGIRSGWEFVDMVGDSEKWEYYCSSDLLVHPSVSENFGITIAEGLAAGIPVICTKGTPWQILEEHHCGWWIDIGAEPLANAIQEAMALSDEERHEMGARGRRLAEEKYTWDAVVKAMVAGYEEILNGKP